MQPPPRAPPSSPSKSFFPAPYRIADDSPPLKRQRHSSTPRPRGSSSATPDDFDIGRERQASAMRMLDVWSQLGDKYARPIAEDDIVDLVTGEIVKDRGVLSAEATWKIGRFADIEDSTGSEEEDDDDADELDAFAASDAKEEISVHGWAVPPVREMDPADAKDLEEFLEAERRRREECGDEEVSEEDGDVEEPQDDADPDTDISQIVQTPEAAPPPPSRRAEVDEPESEDELNFWGAPTTVYLEEEKAAHNEVIIEISDSPAVSPTTPTPKTPSRSKKTPKSQPDREPHPRLQLPTPPKSRTPSSVDDFFIPLASPPSSPLLSPGTSSPTKPGPTTALKRAESSASQVRTRSQSRARSSRPHKDDIDGSIPRLDLAEMTRGRSVHKNTRARSSVPKRSASVGQPESSTSSTKVEPDSAERLKSNPRLASPSSAGRRSMPEGAPGARRSLTKHPTFLMEHTPLSRSPEPVPRSTRKRKRKSLSSDGEDLNPISDSMHDAPASAFESPLASTSKNKIRSSSVSAKLESKRVMDKGASRSEADSEPESDSVHASSHRRPPPPMSAFPPYFSPPGSFYPYPPYAPGTDIHPTMPLQDLRAQFIISQAMHQLSTLYAAPWSAAQPFTPPRRSSASSGTSPHSYPTTPHHPHTHPYVFDSGASRGTLPPSSPPGSSPSSLASSPIHGAGRRSSLVPRSRSRGRREGSSDLLPTARGRARHETRTYEVLDDDRASSSTAKPKQKDKGKEKMVNPSDSEGSDAGSQPRLDTRPRLAERAQTPGPPVTRADVETSRTIPPDSTQRRSAGQSSSTTHRPKGKTRKPI